MGIPCEFPFFYVNLWSMALPTNIKADYVGFKNQLVFNHYLDDTAVKIINLGYGTFVWIQYGPNEGSSCDVELMKQYNEEEIRKMVEHLQPYSKDISALDLFDKFLKTTT